MPTMRPGVRTIAPAAGPFWSRRGWRRYAREARRPLNALALLLPLVVLYEATGWLTARADANAHSLWAPTAIQDLLAWFGLVGFWVPPVVFVAALLVWHRRRRDRWRLHAWVFPAMAGESLVLAVPLWVLSALFATPAPAHVVAALGAAVYEEFVFRFLLLAGLTWLLAEIGHFQRPAALGAAVVLAAVLFALCHFQPVGAEAFAWKPFLFRTVAGVYLSAIFLGRGLGLAGGCHAVFNLLLALLSRAAGG